MASLSSLQTHIHQTAKEKGWWDEPRSVGDVLALIHSEISEGLEEFRNGHAPDEIYFDANGKPEGLPVELADAVIRILDYFGHIGVSAEKVIQVKTDYNDRRSYRHGGKAL